MPSRKKEVIGEGFGKRWRQYLKRVAARTGETIYKVMDTAAGDVIQILDETAPYTQGTTLGKDTPYSPAVRVQKPPVPPSRQGFQKFRRESGGKRTVVVTNAAWGIYLKGLEEGETLHSPSRGGRQFSPGFVQDAIQRAKARAAVRRDR